MNRLARAAVPALLASLLLVAAPASAQQAELPALHAVTKVEGAIDREAVSKKLAALSRP
jgi:hypothetical protein